MSGKSPVRQAGEGCSSNQAHGRTWKRESRGAGNDLPEIQRLLPQAPEAERGLLSSFLNAPREVGALCAERRVGTGHFHLPAHQLLYATMLGLWAEDRPVEFITLTQLLRDRGQLEEVGGAGYVTEVFTYLPTAANAPAYVEILEEKVFLREIIRTCTEYAARSYDEQDDVQRIMGEVQERIAAIGTNQAHQVPTMRDNIIDAVTALQDQVGAGRNVVVTGLRALDEECGPLERGNLLVIGGQTKSGKSILAGQVALNIALRGKPVLFISLEMTERELTQRWLCSLGRLDVRRVKSWSEAEDARFVRAQDTLLPLPLTIVTRAYQLAEIVAACQRAAMRPGHGEPLAAIVLDYAQLAETARSHQHKDDRRQQEIAQISRTCKRLAGQLNVLFILLTQLNDEGRTREGRDIENDANLMVEVKYDRETQARAVKVVLARSAPSGAELALRVIPEHTRVEDEA